MALLPPLAAALLLLASGALAAPLAPGERAVPFASTDALGRAFAIPIPGRVTLLSFASPSNGEAMGEIARAIRLEHPDLEIISFIDLSRYPRLAHGFVRREIARRQRRTVEATRAAFLQSGRTPPADLAERVHVIPDFGAESFATYGVGNTAERAVMVLVGADGIVKALLDAPSLDAVQRAVESVRALR